MNMKENRIERNATIRGRALRGLLLTLCLLLIVGGAAMADGEGEPQPEPQPEPVVQEHTEHDFSVFVETVSEANCTSPAVKRYKCSGCDLTEDRTEGEKNTANHVGGQEVRNARAETCETAGYSGDTVCLGCDTVLEQGHEIAAKSHAWDEGVVTTPATCSAKGVKTFTCKNDASHTYTEPIDIDANAHDWNDWVVTTPVTCTTDGSRTRTCKLNESHTETEVITAPGHNAVAVVAKDPTCEENGNIAYWYCDRCQKYFSDAECLTEIPQESTVIAALDHDWDVENAVVTQQFPCMEGTKTFTCKRDNTHTKTEPVAPTAEHTWVAGEVTKAATTTEEGAQTYTCSVCGTSESRVLPVIATYAVTFYNEDGVTPLAEAKRYEANTPVESIEIPAAPEKVSFLFVTWVNVADGKDIASEIAEKKVLIADAGYKPVYESLTRTSADGLYTYVLNPEKTEATIIAWNGANDGITPISVPQQLDGVNVVAIGDGVFQGRFTDPNLPAIVVIPAGVRTIGNNAFAENPMLAALYLPDTLETVGENIILNDTGLSFLVLTCTQATTLNPANVFIHNVNREGVDTPVTVTLPMNVTDITVTANPLNGNVGNLTIVCPFTVQAGHGVSVEGGTILNNNAALTNYGSVSVYGTFNNNSALYNLGALANAGAFNNASSVFSCYAGATVSGGISGNAVVTAHSYSSETKKCAVCGAELPSLKVKYSGHDADKVYDKTTKSNLKASDFAIEDTHGMDLRIVTSGDNTFSATYDNYNAGKRTISVTLTLEGNDAALYGSKVKTSVSGNITPKEITITPFENNVKINPKRADGTQDKTIRQKKVYGTSDPDSYHGTASGLWDKDKIEGKLTREPGEGVGQYRVLKGTLTTKIGVKVSSNPDKYVYNDDPGNYTINVLEGYFVIEPKSINASDMGLATIGNQRYTGEAVKPTITLSYGKTTLEEGKDFKAEFTNNIQPGTATVKLTGIGNYTGTREATFRILNIASAASGSGGGSSGGSSYSYSGFDDGEGDDEEEGEDEEETESEGTLILGGNDYGTILFDHAGRPYSFVQYEEELPLPDDAAPNAIPDMQLTIVADPLYDEETGEAIMLGDTEREKYDALHLRLTTSLVQTLTGMGYTELVYELENADLHIPLTALLAEIPLEETPEAEVISVIEGEIDESGEIGEDVEELEMDLAPQVLKVDAYDICIEQVEVAELTERETGILQSYEPKVPGYRVRVRAVIDGEEGETSLDMPVATTEEGETLVELPPADKLPEGTYPIGLVLRVLPMDEVYTEQVAGEDPEIDSIIIEHPDEEEEETYQLQGVDAVFISDIETPEDKDIVDVAPAVFHDIDGMLYAGYSVNADGIYCAGTALPEGMVSTFVGYENDENYIALSSDEKGNYGKEIVLNSGTDTEYSYFGFYIPSGSYTVTNKSTVSTQITVYSDGTVLTDGVEEPIPGNQSPIVLMPGDTSSITIEENEYIKLSDGSSDIVFESVNAPEGDSEEEIVDMFSTPANTLSGIGTTFTLDENGNPVVEN